MKRYSYLIAFYSGLVSFGDELKWLRTFSVSFDGEKPSEEDIRKAARERMGYYPRRHTIRWEESIIELPPTTEEKLAAALEILDFYASKDSYVGKYRSIFNSEHYDSEVSLDEGEKARKFLREWINSENS